MSQGRKIFVGTLPDDVQEHEIRAEFSIYGVIEDIFVRSGCERGRQWAMVTYATADQALAAKEATDRVLQMPGSDRPVEVMIARNQSKGADMGGPVASAPIASCPKKIFVGSLPDSITEDVLREEFNRYGYIQDLFLKTGCDRHKQWAFITFSSGEEAESAKSSTDRVLRVPGAEVACEVMIARNQGTNGRDPVRFGNEQIGSGPQGPTKIFVGSLPDCITENTLRSEFCRYGQIQDVYLKTGCDNHKQWAFVIFATHLQAQHAKDACDRTLLVPGARNPCEVMFAKFQGKNGTDPLNNSDSGGRGNSHAGEPSGKSSQYAWRAYQTPTGLTYYHNHNTGVTQWECPPEFRFGMPPPMPQYGGAPRNSSSRMYGASSGMAPHQAMYRPY